MPTQLDLPAFIAKWKRGTLTERSASQQHFLDLCTVLDQPTPAESDPQGTWYTFEKGVRITGGRGGWADVWQRGHFGWEYKGPGRDLSAAYQQLQKYREDLENPVLAALVIRVPLCSCHASDALPSAVRAASFRPPRAPYPSPIIDVFLCSATADYAAHRTPAAHSPRATWALLPRDLTSADDPQAWGSGGGHSVD